MEVASVDVSGCECEDEACLSMVMDADTFDLDADKGGSRKWDS